MAEKGKQNYKWTQDVHKYLENIRYLNKKSLAKSWSQ